MIDKMTSAEADRPPSIKPVDNLTYKTFVKKFNEKYSSELISEQKRLLSHYIGSFTDNGIELKVFLNEEISRLKKSLQNSLNLPEISQDSQMSESTRAVLQTLESFSQKPIDKDLVQGILKIQNLVKEIETP